MGGVQSVQSFFGFDENSDGKERSKNVQFYSNEICSKPRPGHTIEEMLLWHGEYKKLENNHSYIQWLFPIPGSRGMNYAAQKLYENEAKVIRENDTLCCRVLQAYIMMLDFYGMRLLDPNSGEVTRNRSNWKERYTNLNRSTHNYRRISRILISLGELGYERFQVPWVKFLMEEAIVRGVLPNLKGACMIYWINAIKDLEKRNQMSKYYRDLLQTSRTNIKNTELPSVVSNNEPDSECRNGFRSSEDVDKAEGRSKVSESTFKADKATNQRETETLSESAEGMVNPLPDNKHSSGVGTGDNVDTDFDNSCNGKKSKDEKRVQTFNKETLEQRLEFEPGKKTQNEGNKIVTGNNAKDESEADAEKELELRNSAGHTGDVKDTT